MSEEESIGDSERVLGAEALRARDAVMALAHHGHPELAFALSRLVEAVASEALRTPRFAKALTRALTEDRLDGAVKEQPKKSNRRAPGPFDPFAVFAEGGSEGLRNRLDALDLEQLRDIIAEHGMDNDRLAMRWKTRDRVINRIIERVGARAAKGSAFRG